MASSTPAAPIPATAKSKNLRACLLCSIIQTPIDFRRNGCPNCEEIMQMKGSPDRIQACTTTHFDGPSRWVARWQRTNKYVRGVYAITVKGRIPEDVEQDLDSQGIKYRPRDQTEVD
ncbi:transcription initiation protein spt4 [Lactarius quietus]|nr:transcription initiation protein spt4 [Lactarius quietus]